MTLRDKLNDENIKAKHVDIGNQKLKCPSCQPPHNPKDTPLSFTVSNDGGAVWNCHHCGYKGFYNDGTNYTPQKKQYVKPTVPHDKNKPATMYTFFAERGISKETIDQMDIYTEQQWVAFPYKDADASIASIKYRTRDKRFKQSANSKRVLYNYYNTKDEDMVIFVEGEFDALTLIECGYKNVVTLPDGAPSEARFKDNDARFKALENCPLQATKIVLFTDNDQAGKSLHDELLHRFGKDICWYVDYPTGCKDANEVLLKHGATKVREIIESATPYPVDGLYTVEQYYGSVIDLYNGNYVKPIEIGYNNLDEIYRIMKGTFHCVTGIPNHGKSSFVDQMLIKLAENHNWKFAIFSPEHSTSMHLRRLVQMQTKKAFDVGFQNRMDKIELQNSLKYINDRFYFIETKDTVPDIDYILDIAKASVLKYGINGIVIDPYNEVNASRSGNTREDEHIRDFISKCKRFARVHDCVVWVVAHPTKLPKNNDGSYAPPTAYDISGAAHWHNQADAVLTVHRDFDDDSIQVLTRKIREQGLYGKIGQADFLYDHESRSFIEKTADDWDIPLEWQNR